MPQPPPLFSPHRSPPDFAAILKRIEAALRVMKWGRPSIDPPTGIRAFEGNAIIDGVSWMCTIASYTTTVDGDGDGDGDGGLVERVDGAATCFAEMLVCRLTPELAELALQLATRATSV